MGEIAKHNAADLMRPQSTEDFYQLGNILAKSGFFQDSRDAAQAAVKVMAGAELGIPAIAAMTGIHIVKGRVTLGASLIGSRIRAHGYDYRVVTLDNTGCKLEFFGKDRKTLGVSEFTLEDAKAAGLTGNETYKKFPRNMFLSRAISNGARWFTPDIFGGAPVYTPDEMGAPVDANGEYMSEDGTPPARGSRAAAQEVGRRRIAEEQAKQAQAIAEGTPTEPVDALAEALLSRITDDDLPEELRNPSPSWKGTTAYYEMLKSFAQLKKQAGEDVYRRCLQAHGAKHSTDFKNREDAKACYEELTEVIANLTAAAAVPAE